MRTKYFTYGVGLVLPFITPLIVSVQTASASESMSEYSLNSTYDLPSQIVTTSDGSVWFSERSSASTYKDSFANITNSGTITDYSASVSGYSYLNIAGIAADSSGNIWFSGCADTGYNRVVLGKFNTSTHATTMYNTGYLCDNQYYRAGSIAVDASGNIWYGIPYVAGGGSSRVNEYSSSGTLLASWTEAGQQDWDSISAGPSGTVWAADDTTNAIYKLTASGGTISSSAYTVPTSNSGVFAITPGPDGSMWFTESSTGKIGKVTPSGTFTEYALTSGDEPEGITAGTDGALWFTDEQSTGTNVVGRMTTAGSVTGEYTEPTTSGWSQSITADSNGTLWFTEMPTVQVGRLGY